MTDQLVTIFVVGGLTTVSTVFFRPMIANLLSWSQIKLKRPFRKGDFIQSSGFEGIVKKIGFDGVTLTQTDWSTVQIPCSTVTSTPVLNKSSSNYRPAVTEFRLSNGLEERDIMFILGLIRANIEESKYWKGVDVKIKDFSEAGVRVKVIAFFVPHTEEDSYTHHRDEMFAMIVGTIQSHFWPPTDINVLLENKHPHPVKSQVPTMVAKPPSSPTKPEGL